MNYDDLLVEQLAGDIIRRSNWPTLNVNLDNTKLASLRSMLKYGALPEVPPDRLISAIINSLGVLAILTSGERLSPTILQFIEQLYDHLEQLSTFAAPHRLLTWRGKLADSFLISRNNDAAVFQSPVQNRHELSEFVALVGEIEANIHAKAFFQWAYARARLSRSQNSTRISDLAFQVESDDRVGQLESVAIGACKYGELVAHTHNMLVSLDSWPIAQARCWCFLGDRLESEAVAEGWENCVSSMRSATFLTPDRAAKLRAVSEHFHESRELQNLANYSSRRFDTIGVLLRGLSHSQDWSAYRVTRYLPAGADNVLEKLKINEFGLIASQLSLPFWERNDSNEGSDSE